MRGFAHYLYTHLYSIDATTLINGSLKILQYLTGVVVQNGESWNADCKYCVCEGGFIRCANMLGCSDSGETGSGCLVGGDMMLMPGQEYNGCICRNGALDCSTSSYCTRADTGIEDYHFGLVLSLF